MDEIRSLGQSAPDLDAEAHILAEGQRRAAEVFAGFAAAGAVRELPWPIANALITGPTYSYLRLPEASAHAARARLDLPEAAWRAVKA